MRDLFLVLIIAPPLLCALKKPQCGILVWLWISIMNPHKESYGWINTFPLLDVVAAVTILGAIFNLKSTAKSVWHPTLTWLTLFYLWCCLTTVFGVDPNMHIPEWAKFSKTLLICLIMLLYMNKRHWIIAGIAVFVIGIAHTGIKGGLFTLFTGGGYRVYGPPNTSWGDNNGVSIAMLMMIPILLALRHVFSGRYARWGAWGSAALCFVCLLGTQSRGGLVGLIGQVAFAVYRSKQKFLASVVIVLVLGVGLIFMPDSWQERMATIGVSSEELDTSASNRIIQWYYAIDIANERPFFGSGFNAFYYKPYYFRFVAHLDTNRAVHSNYFQVIGEQGYVGFFLYCMMWLTFVLSAQKYAKIALQYEQLRWAGLLLQALQFGFIGYAFNGLTVNMAYLDLPYFLLVFAMLLMSHVGAEAEKLPAPVVKKRRPSIV